MKLDAIKIGRENDGRIKLSRTDEAKIKALYNSGIAIREIARRYEPICSRRSIQFVIFPERRALCAQQFKERRKDGRYKPEKKAWAATMRKHRAKKRELYKPTTAA